LFWSALGCGGVLLVALVIVGVVVGGAFYQSRGAVEAVRTQLQDIKAGNLGAAFARTAASYQAAHTLVAFSAFVERHPGLKDNTDSTFTNRSVENDTATLTGTLAHGGGTESVTYKLVKESQEWRISGIAVGGDEVGAGAAPAAEDARLKIEIVGLNKVPQGQGVVVKFDVRVTGFDLRPEGKVFRVDLVEDLETFGPDGRRMDALSRQGLQTFNQTTASARDATATFKTSMTFARPEPGKYRAVITIRDTVGQGRNQREVAFDLP
jgi:type II secretory pathway pseudopilin PulG